MSSHDQASTDALSLIVVTGLSGAGKSTAINALEDLGYFCVDNLPTPVLQATLDALMEAGERRVALCLDIRAGSYLSGLGGVLDAVHDRGKVTMSVLYLDSSEELLSRRFSATRRPHPLSAGVQSAAGQQQVRAPVEGVRLERELLAPLRARADTVIDTSDLTVHDLRREIFERYGRLGAGAQAMRLRILSFGFKYGIPHDADLLFDVRFLPNPHFVEGLREKSGQDDEVRAYISAQPDASGFLEKVLPLIRFCLPRFRKEGKSYVTIAIGCTGGRHRSVALSEWLREELGSLMEGIEAVHRDVHRNHVNSPIDETGCSGKGEEVESFGAPADVVGPKPTRADSRKAESKEMSATQAGLREEADWRHVWRD